MRLDRLMHRQPRRHRTGGWGKGKGTRSIKLSSLGFDIMSLSVSQGCKSREVSGWGSAVGAGNWGCDVESIAVAGGEHDA